MDRPRAPWFGKDAEHGHVYDAAKQPIDVDDYELKWDLVPIGWPRHGKSFYGADGFMLFQSGEGYLIGGYDEDLNEVQMELEKTKSDGKKTAASLMHKRPHEAAHSRILKELRTHENDDGSSKEIEHDLTDSDSFSDDPDDEIPYSNPKSNPYSPSTMSTPTSTSAAQITPQTRTTSQASDMSAQASGYGTQSTEKKNVILNALKKLADTQKETTEILGRMRTVEGIEPTLEGIDFVSAGFAEIAAQMMARRGPQHPNEPESQPSNSTEPTPTPRRSLRNQPKKSYREQRDSSIESVSSVSDDSMDDDADFNFTNEDEYDEDGSDPDEGKEMPEYDAEMRPPTKGGKRRTEYWEADEETMDRFPHVFES